jgi:hypothetical protein
MKTNNKKSMLGAVPAVFGLMTLLLCTTLATSASAGGQVAQGGNRLVGFFESEVTITNCNGVVLKVIEAYEQFNQGGTLTSVDNQPLRTPGIGTWKHLGAGSYSAPFESFAFNTDGTPAGETKFTRTIQLAADGNSYTSAVTVSIFNVNGNLITTLCATEVATRVVD